jgi:hypothetical protein
MTTKQNLLNHTQVNSALSPEFVTLFRALTLCFFAFLSCEKSLAQGQPIQQDLRVVYGDHSSNTQVSMQGGAAEATVKNYVMGPLEMITDWESFETSLRTLKQNGIEAITTDVWWGLVEPESGQFQWDYYKRYAELVQKVGLKWLPILSFHQAGGNVGDTVDIPVPKWVWNLSSDMKFVGSNGFVNGEYISFWTKEAYPLYERFMKSFADNFAPYNETIGKIYLSLGPAGELRYPSYNAAAGWNYPDIGFLQSYSKRAQNDFRNFLRTKYQDDIKKLNAAWSLSFFDFSDPRITSPDNGAEFFQNGFSTKYGQDFLEWYQGTLEAHAKKMFELGNTHLKNVFFSSAKFEAPLGGKISGVHWKMGDSIYPRAAEKAAGYVDYSKLMTVFGNAKAELTFTCMEMYNNNSFPAFSRPEELVREVLKLAAERGVRVNGENALAISNNPGAYSKIRNVFEQSRLQGFTLLRLGQIVNATGEANAELYGYLDQLVRTRTQHFLVRTHLDAEEIKKRGYEIRIIGNGVNLGNLDVEKGLVLSPAGGRDWRGSTQIAHPDGVAISVVLYNPKTKDVIHEGTGSKRLTGQPDKLFIDAFFGHIIPMGPMIPLKMSRLARSCGPIHMGL